ncbi:MAG: gamma-glutamylcyclotransferase [Cyanobacteria bacterium SBLK]|nr:gamma-glutamylcyclotransferase [Cyanobacteria bacterium SBLK]
MFAVFVYGTLKPGEVNYRGYCQGKAIAAFPAYALGDLYALSLGYPAMTPGREKVWGALLKFNDPEVLQSLDRLEEYEPGRRREENEYQRQEISIYHPSGELLGTAWAYLMEREKIEKLGGRSIPSGCWQNASNSVPNS